MTDFSESDEEFIRRLSQELSAERAVAIGRELRASFESYMLGPAQERVRAHLAQMEANPVMADWSDEFKFASASAVAAADAALAALAVYLARHETPPPESQPSR